MKGSDLCLSALSLDQRNLKNVSVDILIRNKRRKQAETICSLKIAPKTDIHESSGNESRTLRCTLGNEVCELSPYICIEHKDVRGVGILVIIANILYLL